jgi:putative pyruvate formate lyase activating enzyme
MPDFKFWDSQVAEKTCQAPDYPQRACEALVEMHRQVGDLSMDKKGLAVSGLLVRHLVLPRGLAGTPEVMAFIATRVSAQTYVNVMAQYRPCGKASQVEALNRSITTEEYEQALNEAAHAGIRRLDRRRPKFILF